MANYQKSVVGAGAALVTLDIYLFWHWYSSPYKKCVRAMTSFGTERAIEQRDQRRDLKYGTHKSDDDIRAEQKLLADWGCRDALRRATN